MAAVLTIILFIMITFFPPKPIPMMESIASPIRSVDFSSVPELHYYTDRKGSKLAYREYIAQHPKQVVVLVHGSSGSSLSMHALAEYLQKSNITAYAPDIRGHGMSGRKGDIDYIGQLEDDMEDFVQQVIKGHDASLAGSSAGGGFVLRFAASTRQKLFARYILLTPYVGYGSPTVRPNSGGWVSVSMPRIIGLLLLGPIGEKLLGHLPVIRYAIDPQTAKYNTAEYSFRLNRNFSPHYNFRSDIAAVKQPMQVLVGDKDEVHYSTEFHKLFTDIKPDTKITIVPGAGHISLSTEKTGIDAIAKAFMR